MRILFLGSFNACLTNTPARKPETHGNPIFQQLSGVGVEFEASRVPMGTPKSSILMGFFMKFVETAGWITRSNRWPGANGSPVDC